jgi:hypothetical protein
LKEVGANGHKIEKVKMIIALQFVFHVLSFLPYQVECNARNARTENSYVGFLK